MDKDNMVLYTYIIDDLLLWSVLEIMQNVHIFSFFNVPVRNNTWNTSLLCCTSLFILLFMTFSRDLHSTFFTCSKQDRHLMYKNCVRQ